MEIKVHGNHVQVPDDLRTTATKKTERLSHFLSGMERAEVSFSDRLVGRLGEPITCEVVLEGHGHVVRAVGVGNRPGVALDAAVDKAALQLTRLKRKLVGRSRPRHGHGHEQGKVAATNGAGRYNGAVASPDAEELDDAGDLDAGDLDVGDVEGITEL